MTDPLYVVTPLFAPERVGTPHYISDLVRALRDEGQLVRVITNQPYYPSFVRFSGYGRQTRSDTFEGVAVRRLPTIVPRDGRPLWRAISELNFLLQVCSLVALGRIPRSSRVLAVSPGSALAVLAGAILTRRSGRCVAIVHDIQSELAATTGANRILRSSVARMERLSLNQANEITVLSEGMANSLAAQGVRTPISVEPLWATVGTSPVAADENLVLYSGNLGRKQGLPLLLDVAEKLRVLQPRAQVLIRGQGSQRAALEREVTERGLTNVRFADLVPEPELADSLARAAVHVVPQLADGATAAMPSKIYNVLAVGRPVVASAAEKSGIRELARSVEAVRCVPPDDARALAIAIDALLRDPQERERMGYAAMEYIAQHRSRRSAATSYLQRLRADSERPSGPDHGHRR
jgi:colanic acid biosynthesis glycosyl transferase WcaI